MGSRDRGGALDAASPRPPRSVDPDVAAAVEKFGVRPVARAVGVHRRLVQYWLAGSMKPSPEHKRRLQLMQIGEVLDVAREERLRKYAERAAAGRGIFDDESGPVPPDEEIFGLDRDDPEVLAYETGGVAA